MNKVISTDSMYVLCTLTWCDDENRVGLVFLHLLEKVTFCFCDLSKICNSSLSVIPRSYSLKLSLYRMFASTPQISTVSKTRKT